MTPITVSAAAGRLRLTHEIIPGTRPVDIDQVNTDLTEAVTQFNANIRRAKFVHDLKILRATLNALATNTDVSTALDNISVSEQSAQGSTRLLTGYLRTHAWAPAGDTLDLSNGDVIINLTDGWLLVNIRDLEDGADHLETPAGDHWSVGPGNWWKIGNILNVTNATGEDFTDVQRRLDIPEVPGLTILLDQLTVGTE